MKAPALARKRGAWWLMGVLLLLVIVVMAVPSSGLAWIRQTCPLLSRMLSWLEARGGFLDLDHVAFFAATGFLWALVSPAMLRWRLALCLPLLAIITELMQFFVSGRTPRVSDARDDMLGALIGWVLALLLIALYRRISGFRNRSGVR